MAASETNPMAAGREIDHLNGSAAPGAPYDPGMRASTDPLELAAGFDAASEDDWRALVAAVVSKSGRNDARDPVDALSTTTYDGITIRPLYTSGPPAPGLPGAQPYTRGATVDVATAHGWDVRALHRDPDPARVRAAVLADLENGATSVWLMLGDAGPAVADLPAALDGVFLDLAPIALDAGTQTREAAQAFLELVRSRGVAADDVSGTLGADPIGLQARTGAPADLAILGDLATLARPYPNLGVATVDATVYHDAGAGDAAEIGIATAVGVAYLRELTAAGLSVDEAFATLEFRFAVSADQFLSIAKLRAARQVWGRVAELSSAGSARGQRQHAVTSAAMMTRRDPWVNLLRTTIAGFAAAVGGADAITVLPFDSAVGLSDHFARRMARNTSAILHDESSLGRVVDAAGGSWYVETITAELAQKAWEEFTSIERSGGALAALDEISARITATRDARADDIAHRRAPLTGVSEFALPDEAPLPRPSAPSVRAGGPLAPARWAQDYEALRDRVEATTPRPTVFLAALGPFAAHSARVGFAANLFNAGGFRVTIGSVEDFADSGAAVACLCGSDSVYADEGAAAAAALRAAGARYVWLAGPHAVDGVDGTVVTGCDALAVLRTSFEVTA